MVMVDTVDTGGATDTVAMEVMEVLIIHSLHTVPIRQVNPIPISPL